MSPSSCFPPTTIIMSSLNHLLLALLFFAFSSPTLSYQIEQGVLAPVPVAPLSNFDLPKAHPSPFKPAIHKICATTPAPELCENLAIPYADRTTPLPAITPRVVLDLLLRATIDSTLGIYAKAGRIAGNNNTNPADVATLKQCQTGFIAALHDIKAAQAAVAAGNSVGAQGSLDSSLNGIKGCDNVFAQKADNMSPVMDNTAFVENLVGTCRSMVTKALGA